MDLEEAPAPGSARRRPRQLGRSRAAAAALQASLLPSAMPRIEGLELAARYIPAQGALGGDWHDVLALPGGTVGIVMGDVMGHGLGAAIIMGRLRSALRAYALDHADPAEVLRRLDRKIRHFEPGAMATALYAVTDPPYDRIRVSSAGHLPPILAEPARPSRLLPIPTDLPLGVDAAATRTATDVALIPGASLILYTDGLVERRPRPGQRPDDDPLGAALSFLARTIETGNPDTAADTALRTLLGGAQPADDTAILILRRTP